MPTRKYVKDWDDQPEISKEVRVKKEFLRLRKVYKGLPASKQLIVMPLLENLAFMKVTLDDLQKNINAAGCSEEWKNGENQFGKKASADLQAYNSLIKNYNTVSDRLDKMLPPEQRKSKLEALKDG